MSGADGDEEGERRHLMEALRATDWNLTRAASRLGVPRNTLRYRMERLGLTPEGPAARRRGGRPPSTPRVRRRPIDQCRTRAHSTEESREPRREARRVTLVQVRLTAAAPGPEAPEIRRALEATADKLESFGGRVEERSASGLLAAFGLTPEEDAPRRAAHAALAVQRLASRARMDIARRPDAAIALHTQSLPLTQLDETIEIDADALSQARRTVQSLLDAAGPGTVVASADTARFLAPRFDLALLPEGDGATSGRSARREARRGSGGRASSGASASWPS